MEIKSLERTLSTLVDNISNAVELNIDDVAKAKLSLQLVKLTVCLRSIQPLIKMYDVQNSIYDRLFSNLENKSQKELLVLQQIALNRSNDIYNKINNTLASLDLKSIETTLTAINTVSANGIEVDKTKRLEALELLTKITSLSSGTSSSELDKYISKDKMLRESEREVQEFNTSQTVEGSLRESISPVTSALDLIKDNFDEESTIF